MQLESRGGCQEVRRRNPSLFILLKTKSLKVVYSLKSRWLKEKVVPAQQKRGNGTSLSLLVRCEILFHFGL